MGIKNVLANQLLKIAVNRTSPKALRERCQEEWQAWVGALPDGQPKLSAAAGFLRSTFHQENEKIRLVFLIHYAAICSIFFMFSYDKVGYSQTLSGCGIVLGMLAALVLYWEPIATTQNLEFINEQISCCANSNGSSNTTALKLLLRIVRATMGVIIFSYVMLWGILNHAVTHLHGLPGPSFTIGLVCITFTWGPLLMYLAAKMQRRQCRLWLEKLEALRVSQEEARYAEIRRILRLHGYAIACLAGMAQLPAALF